MTATALQTTRKRLKMPQRELADYGNRLRKARLAIHLTQERLAEMWQGSHGNYTGISKWHIRSCEQGTLPISFVSSSFSRRIHALENYAQGVLRWKKKKAKAKTKRWAKAVLSSSSRSFFATRCAKCGSRHRVSQHHMVPRADGGSDHKRNLLPLCNKCHDWAEMNLPPWNILISKGQPDAI